MPRKNDGTRMINSGDHYKQAERWRRQVLKLEDFTAADIAALEQTRAPESSKAFDHEVKS